MNRIDVWFAFVVELAVVATLFPLLAWSVTLLLKRRSAALRFRVWMLALIALVLFPPVSRVLPRLPGAGNPGAFIHPEAYTPGSWESEHFVAPVFDVAKITDNSIIVDSVIESRLSTTLLAEAAVVGLWAFGTIFSLFMVLVSIRLAEKLLRKTSEGQVAESWIVAVGEIARKLGIRTPKLVVGDSVTVPMVVGVFRPVVLLPMEHVDWTPAERDGVLLHELSHLKRRDPLGLVFSRIVFAIYWFHPLVWWVAKRLRIERETACDDTVLLHGEEPQGYATFLLNIASGRPTPWTPALCLAMSESNSVEERIDSVLDSKKQRTPVRRLGRWLTLGGLVAIIFATALFSPVPPLDMFGLKTYTATAWLQVFRNKPYYVYSEKEQRDYDSFVNTQFALIRSPLILEKALENPVVNRMEIVKRQRDWVDWLSKNLKLEAQPKSEMITVSFSTRDPKDAEEIVNSVVNAYFGYIESQSNDWNTRMINQLTLELNRQQNAARLLQDEIRNGLTQAARRGGNMAASETLLRDLYTAEAKLESLRAELKATREYLQNAVPVPEEVLRNEVEKDPVLVDLIKKQTEAQEYLESLQRTLASENDPKILQAKKDLRETLDQVLAHQKTFSVKKAEELQREAKAKIAQSLWEKEAAARTQEILVENLRSRYKEAVQEAGLRTTEIADVSFQQEQLKRINQVLDLLQTRVVSLQTEMSAPSQIQLKKRAMLPKEPDRRWWW